MKNFKNQLAQQIPGWNVECKKTIDFCYKYETASLVRGNDADLTLGILGICKTNGKK